MKNIEIITVREIELEKLIVEMADALLGAKGTFMAFGTPNISTESIKRESKAQEIILTNVFEKYRKMGVK